jgi:hypothetical protein
MRMSSVFNWTGPSQIAKALKPHLGNKKPGAPITLAGTNHHAGAFTKAVLSGGSLEHQIAQVNREVEHHFACAQTVTCDVMRGHHRDEARRLAAKVRALVQSRSPGYVAQLEAERGLS